MGGGTPERAGKLSWASSQDAGAGEKSSEASGSQGLCLCTYAGVRFLVVFILFYFFCGSSEELCDSRRAGQGAGRERNASFWDFKEESVPIPVLMGLVHLLC